MKVLVTGGSGKLGQYVVRDLAEHGHQVFNLDRQDPPDRRIARFYRVDLTATEQIYDLFAQIRPEAVVHLAANPSPQGHPRHRQFLDNISLTHAVMQVAGDFAVGRIVYGSSEQANGWSSVRRCPSEIPFGEAAMTPPPNAYALSKLVGETILDSTVASHPGMAGVSLRLNFVQLPEYYEHAIQHWERAGEHLSPNLWAYVDARDAATACRLSLEVPLEGHHVFMVAAEDSFLPIPTREAVRRHFGDKIRFKEELPEFGSTVDCSLIRTVLGWVPRYTWRDHQPAGRPEELPAIGRM